MGNPSDGFYGKTIALSISNFWADVTIYESAKLVCTYMFNDNVKIMLTPVVLAYAAWCLRSTVEVAGPPSAALH